MAVLTGSQDSGFAIIYHHRAVGLAILGKTSLAFRF